MEPETAKSRSQKLREKAQDSLESNKSFARKNGENEGYLLNLKYQFASLESDFHEWIHGLMGPSDPNRQANQYRHVQTMYLHAATSQSSHMMPKQPTKQPRALT